MNSYIVTKVLKIKTGLIGLSKEQAELRGAQIQATEEKGIFRIVTECHFKVGEKISLENPSLALLMNGLRDEEVEEAPVKKKTTKKSSTKKASTKKTSKKTTSKKTKAEEPVLDLDAALANAVEGE